MTIPWSGVLRLFLQLLTILLQAALLVWAGAAPLVWIVRDGLGPDSVESGWGMSVVKFVVMWGLPALFLVVPLFVLSRVDRRLARFLTQASAGEGEAS
jgi:hypothetical protein